LAGMSVDGLISGLDTTSLISQLVQAEGQPQAQLKTRLTTTQAMATAYRSINTRFDAIRTAAEAVLKPETWAAKKATSSTTSVTLSAGSTAAAGSLAFEVRNLAATHSVVSAGNWVATTDPYGLSSPIAVRDEKGADVGTITIGGSGSLADAVSAINASTYGLSATAVKDDSGKYRLQVTSRTTGAESVFDLGTAGTFTTSVQGRDARVTVGTPGLTTYDVVSSTNSFTTLMDGVTVNVSKLESATVTVGSDPEAVAAKIQAVVDAANSALSGVKTTTDPKGGPASVLKGDTALRNLASRVLQAVSSAVGADGSAAFAGIELNRDGTVAFTKADFLTALQTDPATVQRLFSGTDAVPGVGRRLLGVAQEATGTTTAGTDPARGVLTQLAQGRDKLAEDLQERIESWDLRLALRKQTLTRQFTAMETALSSMKNQSTWLAGQLNSLSSSS
jgi:flagellar hook-associated protein 2